MKPNNLLNRTHCGMRLVQTFGIGITSDTPSPKEQEMIRSSIVRMFGTLLLVLSSTPVYAQLAIGDEPPEELGKTRQGNLVSVADHHGRVIAVSFWASWCAPCQVELPMLEKLQRVLGPDKLRVIAVNIEDRDVFRNVARQMFDWQSVITNDPYKDAYKAYKGTSIPYLLIISRDGKVRQIFRGYSEESIKKVVSAVADAVNE